MHSQEERKENDHTTITLSDYAIAHAYGIDLGKSNYQATAVIRFQLLVLELLERGILELGEKWNFAIDALSRPTLSTLPSMTTFCG